MADIFKKIKQTVTDLTRDKSVSDWLTDLGEARKRLDEFLKEGERCVNIFEQGRKKTAETTPDYNVLYANTETIGPAVYSALPRPMVKRRFSDPNDTADAGARVVQNVLSYLMKCEEDGYSPFDDLIKSARTEALVPGWGATRFRIDAEVEEDKVTREATICGDEVPWDRILIGYAKKWAKVPWVAFEHFLTREDCIKTFGDTLGKQLPMNATPKQDGDKPTSMPADAEGAKFFHVYEIWDKRDKKVKFVSDGWPSIVKEVSDPLKLERFFPMPRPLQFTQTVSSMNPIPLFLFYEKQAQELNEVTRRIGKITRALKVRGVYDSTIGDIARVLTDAEDNELVPASNVVALQDGKGLDSSIWLMPIEKLITVVQQLYINRENTKKVIYEITGIADIMRGSSAASETLGAQQIKQQWGGMRLKTYQDEIARYVVDSLHIMAELACTNYTIDQFKQTTGILLPMNADRQQAQMQLQQIQQQMQQQQAAQMQGGAPGQPPQAPPQPQQPPMPGQPAPQNPMTQQMKMLERVVQSPTWEEVTAFLKNDLTRNYAIQIETNSTLAEQMTEDRQDLVAFMQAGGPFIQQVMSQAKEQILPFDIAKAMILAVFQKFRIGYDLEDQLKQMQAPPVAQLGMDPKSQAEIMLLQQKGQIEQQIGQQKLELGQQQMALEKAHGDMKLGLERDKRMLEREKMAHERELAQHEHGMAVQKAHLDQHVAQTDAQTSLIEAEAAQQAALHPPQPAGAA